MSTTPKRRGPKLKYDQPLVERPIGFPPDQIAQIDAAGPRNGAQYVRDSVAFRMAHESLVSSWLATRGNSASE